MTDELDTPFAVNPNDIAQYREHGFVHLARVLSPETLGLYGPAITEATLRLNHDHRPLEERSTYDRAFLQVMNLWRADQAARKFVFGKRLAGIAATLLGVRAVRLYHDQSLYKEPAGGITPAHADQYYWPLSSDHTITAWVPLQAVPLEMGPLSFYAGSHREAFGRDLPISDESEAEISREMEARGFAIVNEPYNLGDVSFHGGWTFHRAGPNISTNPRSVMTIIYMDADMRVAAPANEMQRVDSAQWLPGLRPGDLAASALNPVLFETAHD
jgi:ectoine hydroxylase-related dioxygenase (phytanoyl-CoA dioxygenase family)